MYPALEGLFHEGARAFDKAIQLVSLVMENNKGGPRTASVRISGGDAGGLLDKGVMLNKADRMTGLI
jgi:hypothetical protein